MERAPVRAPLIKNLEFKVGLLLSLTILLAVGFVLNALHARGAFETTQRLILVADNAEGVSVGMPMTFSGFPVGRVKTMTLTDQGRVRLEMAVPEDDARWLRETSVFTLEKSLVGGAKIRVHSVDLGAPQLPDGSERPLLTGDVAAEIPEVVARVKGILNNVEAMTRADSSINASLAHVRTVTERMAGDYGVVGGLLGSPEHARKVVAAIDNANSLLKSVNGVTLKADGMLSQVNQQVLGKDGLVPGVRQTVEQVNTLLADARGSLKRVDTILKEAEAAAGNVKGITADAKAATADLATLRAEVDDSLAKVNHLINELNRMWPFARDVEVKLP